MVGVPVVTYVGSYLGSLDGSTDKSVDGKFCGFLAEWTYFRS